MSFGMLESQKDKNESVSKDSDLSVITENVNNYTLYVSNSIAFACKLYSFFDLIELVNPVVPRKLLRRLAFLAIFIDPEGHNKPEDVGNFELPFYSESNSNNLCNSSSL